MEKIQKRVTALAEALVDRKTKAAECLSVLREFIDLLYPELEQRIQEVGAKNGDVKTDVQFRQAEEGLRSLSFAWEGDRIILAPVGIAALPDSGSHALPDPSIKVQSGRVVIFKQPYASSDAVAVGEIYVFPDRVWCAGGMGAQMPAQDFAPPTIAMLSLTLLERLTHSFSHHHRPLDRTTFDFASQSVRESIGFELNQDKSS